jgi:hypothetical protein
VFMKLCITFLVPTVTITVLLTPLTEETATICSENVTNFS